MQQEEETFTFFFTDIEDSTRRWESHGAVMADALARHDSILQDVLGEVAGRVFKHTGDGMCVAFDGPDSAVRAVRGAVEIQRRLLDEPWGELGELKVRMGLHSGPAERRRDDFFGVSLNRVARFMSAASGGQIVVSDTVRAQAERDLDDIGFRDLGWHRFKGLASPEHMFHVEAPGLAPPESLPPLKSLNPVRGNLPAREGELIGRDAELRSTSEALAATLLVTIVGPPGVGKTRLAVEAGWQSLGRYPDGVVFVDLTTIAARSGIDDAVLHALGVDPQGVSRRDALLTHLCGRQLLLLLDNCEHVLAAAAELAAAILASCPRISMLATSRRRLSVATERVCQLEPLAAEGSTDGPAVELFVARAREANADFTLGPANRDAVRSICAKLDGIPHALELAATQLAVVTPAELDELLTERFRLLADGSSTRSEHQRTLRATVDWSFDLLDDRERQVLTDMSVFAGTCDRASVAAVAGVDNIEVVAILSRLVQHSLVRAGAQGETLRYRLLETVRTYGSERLAERGELDAIREAHSLWYRDRNEVAAAGLRTPAELEWVERISLDLPDIRAALATAIESRDTDRAARIVGALSPFEVIRWSEVARWAGEVLLLPDADEHPLAVVLYAQWASAAFLEADEDTVIARCREGLAIAERQQRNPGAHIWEMLASACSISWDWSSVLEYIERAIAVARVAGDPYELAGSLSGLAAYAFWAGDEERAVAAAEECSVRARECGAPTVLANAVGTLGTTLMRREPERARALLREGIEQSRAARSTFHHMFFLRNLALLEMGVGNRLDAAVLHLASLDISVQLGDNAHFCMTSDGFVNLLASLRLDAPAAALAGWLAAHTAQVGSAPLRDATADRVRVRLGDAEFEALATFGSAMGNVDLMAWLSGEIQDQLPEVQAHDPLGLL